MKDINTKLVQTKIIESYQNDPANSVKVTLRIDSKMLRDIDILEIKNYKTRNSKIIELLKMSLNIHHAIFKSD
jgi:hypothetical protein